MERSTQKMVTFKSDEQNQWGQFRVDIESKKGEWLDERYPPGGDRKSEISKLPQGTLIDEGITKKESTNARYISRNPEIVEEVVAEIEKSGIVFAYNGLQF